MPRASLRPCTYPGCNNLGDGPRCPAHPYPVKRDARISAARRGYDQDWRDLRRWFLRHNPICMIRVKCYGAPASEVDHVTPLTLGGNRLDKSNLQSACGDCHKWKTAAVDKPAQARAGVNPRDQHRRRR